MRNLFPGGNVQVLPRSFYLFVCLSILMLETNSISFGFILISPTEVSMSFFLDSKRMMIPIENKEERKQ